MHGLMPFCWKSIFATSLSDEYSASFDAFLVPFTAALSLQNLEFLIPEGTSPFGKFVWAETIQRMEPN